MVSAIDRRSPSYRAGSGHGYGNLLLEQPVFIAEGRQSSPVERPGMEDRRLAASGRDCVVLVTANDDVAQHEQSDMGVVLGVPYLVRCQQYFVRVPGCAFNLDVPQVFADLYDVVEAF